MEMTSMTKDKALKTVAVRYFKNSFEQSKLRI